MRITTINIYQMPIFNRTDSYCAAQSPGGHPFFYVGVIGISLIYFLPLIHLWWTSPRYLHTRLKSISFTWRSVPSRFLVWAACISVMSIWPYCLQGATGHLVFLVLISAFIMLTAFANGAPFEVIEERMWPELYTSEWSKFVNFWNNLFVFSRWRPKHDKMRPDSFDDYEDDDKVVGSATVLYLQAKLLLERRREATEENLKEHITDVQMRFFNFEDDKVNEMARKAHGLLAGVVFTLIMVASTLSLAMDFGDGNSEYAMGVLLVVGLYLEFAIMAASLFAREGYGLHHERWNTSTSDMERLFVFTAFVFVAVIPNERVVLS